MLYIIYIAKNGTLGGGPVIFPHSENAACGRVFSYMRLSSRRRDSCEVSFCLEKYTESVVMVIFCEKKNNFRYACAETIFIF